MTPEEAHSGKILHVIETTGPGGAETVFLQVADGLRSRGWPPRLVVHGPGWVLDGARRLDLPVELVESRGRLDWRLLLSLWKLVRRHDVRLIHAHLSGSSLYASVVGALTGTPVVSTFHGRPDLEAGGRSRHLRYGFMAWYSHPVCVSAALREELGEVPGMDRADIRVVHNGVDVRAFEEADGRAVRAEHEIAEEAILVGALGNIRPAKDFANLLRAAALLAPDERFAFAIVGQRTDPLHAELVTLRDELGLEDRASFWGFRTDAPEVVAAFDVLAISSSTEGFSLVAVQGMAAGTPVVATRSGGPEEIITDGEDGILVPTDSPEALAAAIRRLTEEAELRDRLVARARRTARSRFSLESMLDGYEELYGQLLSRDVSARGAS